MFGNPMEIALLAGAAILLFGGNKIKDVARSLGGVKKEFAVGQAEADIAHERTLAEARAMAEAKAAAQTVVPANGMTTIAPPTPHPTEPVAPQN